MSTAVISHEYTTKQAHVLHNGLRPPLLSDATAIVFVINDDASAREWLGMLMRNEGWRAETYASAQEFLARPRAVVPNCLVLDVALSEVNGLDLQKRLATERRDMPIIFIADHVDVPTTVQAMKAGAVEFFTKPFRDDLLLVPFEKRSSTAVLRSGTTRRRGRSGTITHYLQLGNVRSGRW